MPSKEHDILMYSLINGRYNKENPRMYDSISEANYLKFHNETYNLDNSKLNITYYGGIGSGDGHVKLVTDLNSRKKPVSLIIYDSRRFPDVDEEEFLFHHFINKKFPEIKKMVCFGRRFSPERDKHRKFGMDYLDQLFSTKNGIFDQDAFDEYFKELKLVEKNRFPRRNYDYEEEKRKAPNIAKSVFNKIDEFVELGFTGFVDTPFLHHLIKEETKSLLRFNLSNKPSKLYLIVAPSGFGKTSLIKELKYCGVKQIPKITTRPNRLLLNFENLGVKDNISQTISKEMKDEAKKEFGENYKKEVTSILNDMLQESNIEDSEYFKNNNDAESFLDTYLFMKETFFNLLFNTPSIKPTSNQGVKSIRLSKFKKKINNEEIIGSHLYKGNLYGFEKKEFNKLLDSTTQYLFDICDLETAMKVREKNQDLVEIIGIFPSLSFAGVGLEKRIETYKVREHTQKNLVNETKKRLNQIIEDSKFIEENHNKFDFILNKDTIVENRNMMLDYLSKD